MLYMPVDKPKLLYLNMILLGFCNSVLLSSIFSSVALTVPKSGVSMAYSILALVENFGIGVFPLYFGWLSKERTVESYNNCLINLIFLAVLSVGSALVLLIHDLRRNHLLELPENCDKVEKIRSVINTDYLRRSFQDSKQASRGGSRGGSRGNSRRGSMIVNNIAQENSDDDSTSGPSQPVPPHPVLHSSNTLTLPHTTSQG